MTYQKHTNFSIESVPVNKTISSQSKLNEMGKLEKKYKFQR